MELQATIQKMLNGEEVRLTSVARELWANEWMKSHGYDENGAGTFALLSLSSNGTFTICSKNHLISDGWHSSCFREKYTRKK